MKTVVITIGTPTADDIIFVEYTGSRGGCTKAEVRVPDIEVREPLVRDGLATLLAGDINANWMKEAFSAKVNDKGQLIIGCSDAVADVKFKVYVEGKGGTTAEIMEF